MECHLSLLIIRNEKPKKITTRKEVWICDPVIIINAVNFCVEFL